MTLAFHLVALTGLAYFLFAKRRFDWLSVAYFSAFVYFLPGFVGVTYVHHYELPLHTEAYAILILVLSSVTATAVFLDRRPPRLTRLLRLRGCQYVPEVIVGVALLGFALAVYASGSDLLLPNKRQAIESFTAWHRVWAAGATLGAVVCFARRRYVLLLICVAMILSYLFVGFRVFLAIAAVGIITEALSRRGKIRLALASPHVTVTAALIGLLIFGYKKVYIEVKMGDFDSVWASVTSGSFLRDAFMYSEPFTTQHVLNAVVTLDLRVGLEHFSEVVAASFTNMLRDENVKVDFNEKYQPVFFADVKGGMASNPWAEMWSAGDWPVLVAFVALFCGLLYLASSRWRVMDPSYRGFVGTMMGFWAFYIHRNDSYRLLSFFKQYSLLFVGCVLVSSALALILYARGDHDDTWQPARQPARRQVGGSPPVSS